MRSPLTVTSSISIWMWSTVRSPVTVVFGLMVQSVEVMMTSSSIVPDRVVVSVHFTAALTWVRRARREATAMESAGDSLKVLVGGAMKIRILESIN